MLKLINNPTECGYHSCMNECCNYPSTDIEDIIHSNPPLPCPNDEFPNYCPLQDGIIARRVSKIIPSVHWQLKRRNRRYCAFYLSGNMSKNNCTNNHFRKLGAMVYPKCTGVNCGQYATRIKIT